MDGNESGVRMRGARITLAGLVLLVATACSNGIAGQPSAAEIPPPSASESVTQSLVDLGEAGAVHYKGSLTSGTDEKVTFDLTAALTGEVFGAITVDGKPASVLVLNKTLYLKGPAEFWTTLSGLGNAEGKGTAIADRWVKWPGVLLGVEFSEVFTPDLISQSLRKDTSKAGSEALANREKSSVGGVEAVEVPVSSGKVFLASKAPHGVVKFELSELGSSDTTKVSELVTDVVDVSANATKFFQDVAAQAAQLNTAVDALTSVEQGAHRFDGCDAADCSLIVEFTNTAKVPVRVHVRANWTGDNAPLGTCEAQVGPIAPGQPGTATCTLATVEWVNFYRTAHSVAGTHPYGAEWSALVLADAPDLGGLNARAAAKPADPKAKKTEGSHYVYEISHAGSDGKEQVWKYGVVGSKYWQDHAKEQLRNCLGTTRSVCSFSLVTASDDAASAHALEKQLVETYRSESGQCPAGQWVSCKR